MDQIKPPQPPPAMIKAEDIVPVMQNLMDERRRVRQQIARDVTPETACFANTIQPLMDNQNRATGKICVIYMLQNAGSDEATRKACQQAMQLHNKATAEQMATSGLYPLLQAVEDRDESLDADLRKYARALLRDYTRSGFGSLDPDQRETYLGTKTAISELERNFSRNITDESGGLRFSRAELEGVPESDLAGVLDESEEFPDQPYLVPFRRFALMAYADSPEVRKRFWLANVQKLPQNVEIFKEVIVRRDANARLLGYPDHATFRLENNMAKTAGWVNDILGQVQDAMLPQGKKELEVLVARKAEHYRQLGLVDSYPDALAAWDYKYYLRLAKKDVHVEDDKISEYFPLHHTVLRMLDLYADCLQLRFDQLSAENIADSLWHESVQAWAVWDERPDKNGEFVGYLFMDLTWRTGKYHGNQDVNLQPSYIDASDGKRVYPATLLRCRFSPASGSGRVLLKHADVVTLFHELGHGIHDLVGRTRMTRFHGWGARDFGEIPSVLLENWCWLKDELKGMSCHYTHLDDQWLDEWQTQHPGEDPPPRQIPDALVDPLIASRHSFDALWFLDQIAAARFDMQLHTPESHEACEALDPTKMNNEIEAELTLLHVPDFADRGHSHVHYVHLLAGYDAGYYGYLSSYAIAADLFESAFAAGPRDRATWDRYRHTVLEPAGSADEMQMLHDFLGRPPNAKALLRCFSS